MHMTTSVLTDLQQDFRGTLILPADANYEVARKVFNGMIDRRPAIIARCEGVDDVKLAIRFGRDAGLLVAVRGGGHGVACHRSLEHERHPPPRSSRKNNSHRPWPHLG